MRRYVNDIVNHYYISEGLNFVLDNAWRLTRSALPLPMGAISQRNIGLVLGCWVQLWLTKTPIHWMIQRSKNDPWNRFCVVYPFTLIFSVCMHYQEPRTKRTWPAEFSPPLRSPIFLRVRNFCLIILLLYSVQPSSTNFNDIFLIYEWHLDSQLYRILDGIREIRSLYRRKKVYNAEHRDVADRSHSP